VLDFGFSNNEIAYEIIELTYFDRLGRGLKPWGCCVFILPLAEANGKG
jgi:hypothetical protein